MIRSFPRLAMGLQAVVKLAQEIAHKRAPDGVAHVPQALAELSKALAGHQERRLVGAARRRFKKRAQILQQACVRLAHRLAAAARPAHALRVNLLAARNSFSAPPIVLRASPVAPPTPR